MAGPTIETTTLVIQRLVQTDIPTGEQPELVGLLAALAGLRLPRERLLAVLRRDPMIREILQESNVAQGWWEEGHARGRQEGLEEGRREGRQEGQRELVRLALESRFGALDAEEQTAPAAADGATLQAIVVNLTAGSREQVRVRPGLSGLPSIPEQPRSSLNYQRKLREARS